MSDDLFHELIDPYESTFQKGKEDGKKAALQQGYNDGFQLGKLKALEIGIELGYMSSVCQMTLKEIENNYPKNKINVCDVLESNTIKGTLVGAVNGAGTSTSAIERKRKRLRDLLDAIEAFPRPETIFKHKNCTGFERDDLDLGDDEEEALQTLTGHDPLQQYYQQQQHQPTLRSTERSVDIDIVSMMQRLRAKFKTVLIQTNRNDLGLKNIMDQINVDNSVTDDMKDGSKGEIKVKDQTMVKIGPIDEW